MLPSQRLTKPSLEFSPDDISLVTKTVDQKTVIVTDRIVNPWTVLKSLGAGTKAFIDTRFPKARSYLGPLDWWSPPPYVEFPELADLQHDSGVQENSGEPDSASATGSVQSHTPRVDRSNESFLTRWLPLLDPPSQETMRAFNAFHNASAGVSLAQLNLAEPGRGGCLVTGTIQLSGHKGSAFFHVKAVYYPLARQSRVLEVYLDHFKPYAQRPEGGN